MMPDYVVYGIAVMLFIMVLGIALADRIFNRKGSK